MKDLILYNLYGGIGGGYGGPDYCGTDFFGSEEEAMDVARQEAIDEYQTQEGLNGLPDPESIADDMDLDIDADADEIDEIYNEEVDSWIDYFAIPTDEDNIVDGYLHGYDDSIEEFKNDYAFLSNFYIAPFAYNGKVWQSAEAAFQASKTLNEAEQEAIRMAKTPAEAKRMGRRCTLRPDWDEVKIDVMRDVVRAKFDANATLRQMLMDTGTKYLIEGNYWHDNFWGICYNDLQTQDGKKHNVLGTILMELRFKYEEDSWREKR